MRILTTSSSVLARLLGTITYTLTVQCAPPPLPAYEPGDKDLRREAIISAQLRAELPEMVELKLFGELSVC
jgi:hypothetical protein